MTRWQNFLFFGEDLSIKHLASLYSGNVTEVVTDTVSNVMMYIQETDCWKKNIGLGLGSIDCLIF